MAVPDAGHERPDRILITAAGRDRLARWLFAQTSTLATIGGLHWEHLGTSARMVWMDHADDIINMLRD